MRPRLTRRVVAALVLALAGLAACSSKPAEPSNTALIVVDVPLAKAGLLAQQIVRGAELAAAQINDSGGVAVGASRFRLRVKVMDSKASPEQTASNVRDAISLGAVAVVDEGTGVDASWQIANAAGLPVGIVFQGATSLVDPVKRPNVYRIAPTDRGISFRFAEYLIPKGSKIAFIHDDSTYGNGGAQAFVTAFARNHSSVAATIPVAADATDVSTEVLRARHSGATAMLVWARPSIVALAVRAARSTGWTVPIYTSTSGGDPIVRQQLSDHPGWADGITFASSRLTSEKGPGPYEAFRTEYEKKFGAERVGVTSGGKPVVQVPDQAMYSYDFVLLLGAAITRAGAARPGRALVKALEQVTVQGANGDERSFNEVNHEGVVDDDVFFAVIEKMIWLPVKDDRLSATLPAIRQTI